MSHMIEQNFAVFAKQDGAAWHSIGTEINPEAGFDNQVLAAKAACPELLSPYHLEPLWIRQPDGTYVQHPTKSAVVRDCDGLVLNGTVGTTTFRLAQPRDTWILARRILLHSEATLSFAAFLNGGSRILHSWNLGDFEIAGERHQRFATITNGFDGSYAEEIMLVVQRVVCNNTLIAARAEVEDQDADTLAEQAKSYNKIKNTKGATAREQTAISELTDILNRFGKIKTWSEELTKIHLTPADQVQMVAEALTSVGKDPRKSAKALGQAETIVDLISNGAGNAAWAGTAYGLWQGFTDFYSHHALVKGARSSQETDDSEAGRIAVLESSLVGTIASERARVQRAIAKLVAVPLAA